MRLWSLHPRYLDVKGLTAVWREGLLAQAVLAGQTRGYRSHPQLARFKAADDPQAAIAAYLRAVAGEAGRRGYHFAVGKIKAIANASQIPVARGQLLYEWRHLLKKLRERAPMQWEQYQALGCPEVHPLFYIVEGEIEPWEVTQDVKS